MKKILFTLILSLTVSFILTGCDLLGQTGVYELTTGVSHEERGTVDPPSREYESGTEVTVEAVPSRPGGIDFGWAFVRWEGDLNSSKNPETFTIRNDMVVTALFDLKEYDLNVNIEGQGQVTEEIKGEDGGAGEHFGRDYKHGTNVILTATPAAGWVFKNWQGDINDVSNPLTRAYMWYELNLTAVFVPQ